MQCKNDLACHVFSTVDFATWDRMAPLKKINKCLAGGYVKMQHMLMDESVPDCDACKQILNECKYDFAAYKELVDAKKDKEGLGDLEQPDPVHQAEPAPDAQAEPAPDAQAEPPLQLGKLQRSSRRKRKSLFDDVEAEALQAAKEFEPTLVLLPRGTHNKKVPYRCTVCRTRAQPEGKVGECGMMRPYMIRFYMSQHIDSGGHQQHLEAQNQPVAEVMRNLVPCEAISLGHPMPGSILHVHAEEFNTWASFANLRATAKHEYYKHATEGCWYVRSLKCQKTVEENISKSRQVCAECQKLTLSNSIVRAPLRFATKYLSAKLLHARIFETAQDVEECIQEIHETALFQMKMSKSISC